MKALINKSFKAVRVGTYVTASEDAGEFILNTEESELSNATLHEIAKACKIAVAKGANKETLLEALEEGIGEMKLPTQNEKPDTMIVAEIVKAGVEKGLDDEDMVVQILEAGIKYKHAARMFQNAIQELGLRVSNKERRERAWAILQEAQFAPEDFTEVSKMAEHLADVIPDTEVSKALGVIRGYCKENEIEMPKPEKGKGIVGGLRGKFQAFILKAPHSSKEEVFRFFKDEGKEDKTAEKFWTALEFSRKYAKAWNSVQPPKN